jgi:hypothetical protein
MPEWKLHVRSADLRRVAEVDDYTQLELVMRFNRTGTWVLDLPAGTEAAAALAGFDAGLIVTRDGRTVMSGPVTGITRQRDADTNSLTVAGVDDSVWLARRLALPVPSGPPYTAAAYDVRSGAAETVLRAYVDANLGPGARPERRVLGLTLAPDQLRGKTVKGRARFQTVGELLARLALVGLGYRIVQVGNGLVFEVYVPTDRTRTAVFSEELGNLDGFTYQAQAAEANYVIAAGGGEGTARVFAERGDSTSIVRYGRIETFLDQRQTTDPTELQQAIDEELAERAEQVGLSISPADTEALKFGRDYDLGDRVTVMVDSTPIRDVLREVKITLDGGGETVTPTVGTPDGPRPGQVLRLFDRMRSLQRRVSNVERR